MSFKNIKYGKKTERRNYSKMMYDVDLPDLIEIQTQSFEKFIKSDLLELLKELSPIEGNNGDIKLYFESVEVQEPNFTIAESKTRDITYSAQVMADVKLENCITGELREAKVLLTEMPSMTPTATFIINGAERVVVSQIVRSSGVYYTKDINKKINKVIYSGQMIPTRGAWVEFEEGNKELLWAKLDRSKKISLTTFIKALGVPSNKEIDKLFKSEQLKETLEKDVTKTSDDAVVEIVSRLRQGEIIPVSGARELIRQRLFDIRRYNLLGVGRYKFNQKLDVLSRVKNTYLAADLKDAKGKVVLQANTLLDEEALKVLDANRHLFRKEVISADNSLQNIDKVAVLTEYVGEGDHVQLVTTEPIYNIKTGEVVFDAGTQIDEQVLRTLRELRNGLDEKVLNYFLTGNVFEKPAQRQPVYAEILDVVKRTDLGESQAIRVIGNDSREAKTYITVSDIVAGISYFLNLYENIGQTDDIDHLGNRRVRLIGELLANQFRIGMARAEKNIKDKMSVKSFADITIPAIMNTKPLTTVLNAFFGSSQLSQFMDQTNPLAELTQKRRVSALGSGGISRDRAGIEVRDVHASHYGRICPIETPEGQSIGLISSLSSYAKIDKYGFIQTPYFKLDRTNQVNGVCVPKVVDHHLYLTADEEYNAVIASAATELNPDGTIKEPTVTGRLRGETGIFAREDVEYMDVSSKQIVSVATATIPFLEHDEASRCLMGANMQRQAVPVIKPEAPLVGTGIEYRAAKNSGTSVVAKNAGYAVYVDAKRIDVLPIPDKTIKYDGKVLFAPNSDWTAEQALKIYKYGLSNTDVYTLINYERSNQNTSIVQKPIVNVGDWVDLNETIADGPSTDNAELALGRNVTVAFMTWEGYNFEDAVIVSEDLVKNDVYTSVHIDEYQIQTRDLRNNIGKEEFTNEVPNANRQAVAKLDQKGVILLGSEVKEGDILVGKITPKGGAEPSPAEKLIQEIIGEKSKEYRDTSLRVPHGGGGIVQKIQYFSKKNKDQLPPSVNEQIKVFIAKKRKIREGDKMAGRHGNKGVISIVVPREDMPYMADGTPVDIMLNPLGVPSRMNIGQILELHLGYAAKKLGIKIATPVFDGVENADLVDILKEANLPLNGKMTLYDGRTGEPFRNPVSVGVMYMIKLSHMVDDKLHARNVGPYTLVTQQPMGGKAQNGGQKLGEMEVWALYGYGAAHVLQEMLTIKSDDKVGRNKAYSAITQGNLIPRPSLPESFHVLTRELQALGIYVELINSETGENDAVKSLLDLKPTRSNGGI